MLLAVIVIAAAACGSGDSATPTPIAQGTLAGVVTIGPLCPVEPCNSTVNPYPGHEIVVRDLEGQFAAAAELNDDGTFTVSVPAGDYEISMEPCEYLGCRFGVATPVAVRSNDVTNVEIDIDTGIR